MSLSIWNNLKQPPEYALKKIKGGRLAGMTDVNPQWRYQAMTEQFGICGIGWKYDIKRVWIEAGTEGQVLAFAEVSLYIRVKEEGAKNDGWSDGIPGIGGSMMTTKEKSGLHSSDECYKMAVTDALSVAMKMVGVAADIYAGRWDGSKYRDVAEPTQKSDPEKPLSKAQGTAIIELAARNHNLSENEAKQVIDWYCAENGRTYHSGKELLTEWAIIFDAFLDERDKKLTEAVK